jgi:2-phosphosulfolactate phosphatase
MHFDQAGYDLRCEWGLEGLLALQDDSDAIVIVDVLSFSTAVDIALSQGASVLPYRWKDGSAKAYAAEKGAVLADERHPEAEYSLSPACLRAIPAGTRIVMPSPNGSTLSLSAGNVPLFTACLRNAPAVAKRAYALGPHVSVVPAGERWNGSLLRPCLEDLIGAGSLIAELPGTLSPEAEVAVAAFARFHGDLRSALFRSGSGRELVARGFAADVELAADHAISGVAPMLEGEQFIDAAARTSSHLLDPR